mmetsp:Transcript_112900/g.319389  ORF Transcript_112900/g.319389 Transcript_112900/m.319389 type:complete len:230 (+) Transcript_112900:151-840(+)
MPMNSVRRCPQPGWTQERTVHGKHMLRMRAAIAGRCQAPVSWAGFWSLTGAERASTGKAPAVASTTAAASNSGTTSAGPIGDASVWSAMPRSGSRKRPGASSRSGCFLCLWWRRSEDVGDALFAPCRGDVCRGSCRTASPHAAAAVLRLMSPRTSSTLSRPCRQRRAKSVRVRMPSSTWAWSVTRRCCSPEARKCWKARATGVFQCVTSGASSALGRSLWVLFFGEPST